MAGADFSRRATLDLAQRKAERITGADGSKGLNPGDFHSEPRALRQCWFWWSRDSPMRVADFHPFFSFQATRDVIDSGRAGILGLFCDLHGRGHAIVSILRHIHMSLVTCR